jgi:voltage-gated potassium channel
LLRLFRVLRLFGVVSRLSSHYPYVFRRGIAEYIVVVGMLLTTVIFGTVSMYFFEAGADREGGQPVANAVADVLPTGPRDPANGQSRNVQNENKAANKNEFNLETSFWFSIYSMFAGEPTPVTPQTIGGKVIAVLVMFMGVTIFAMFTGTVTAFMVERFRVGNSDVEIADVEHHLIICGWNSRAEIIIREYRSTTRTRYLPIVVISEQEIDLLSVPEDIRANVMFVHDDFTRMVALDRANVLRAEACIILSDTSGGRSEQDADARTILGALTVEKMNPEIYTCAELMNRSYGSHLEMGHVDDYVVSGEYNAYMLAQATLNRGLMGMLNELITNQHGQTFRRLVVPREWEGATYIDKMVQLKRDSNVALIGVRDADGEIVVNPVDHVFQLEDEIVVICNSNFKL